MPVGNVQTPLNHGIRDPGRNHPRVSASPNCTDRTMKKYGGVIEPDELVSNAIEVVPRALAWLRRP